MAKTVEKKPGRPVKYPLTSAQTRRIITLFGKGYSAPTIAAELDVHPFAVIRVRRLQAKGASA